MECENRNAINMLSFLKGRLTRLRKAGDKEECGLSPRRDDKAMHRSLPVRCHHLCKQCHDQTTDARRCQPSLPTSPAAVGPRIRSADPGALCYVCQQRAAVQDRQHLMKDSPALTTLPANGCVPDRASREHPNGRACLGRGRACLENGRVALGNGLTCRDVAKMRAEPCRACLLHGENGRAVLSCTIRNDGTAKVARRNDGRPTCSHQMVVVGVGGCCDSRMPFENGVVHAKCAGRVKQAECCQVDGKSHKKSASASAKFDVERFKPSAIGSGTKTRKDKQSAENKQGALKQGQRQQSKVSGKGAPKKKEKGVEQVTHFCRLLPSPLAEESTMPEDFPPVKPLSDSQRIRKVILELIETEKQYVKDLQCLIERYLEPLQEETYLSGEDIQQLFGNIQEIVAFQKLFLLSLQEAVELEPNFNMLTDPVAFKDDDLRRVLFSLAGSFLYYANHFKLYSSFCASHSKAQKVFNADANQQLQEFLRARNPKQQHSSTLESYLIKPIQRILKYPLLLKQLKDLTDPQSDEHHHLCEALRGMEAVAEHINEMQKIYEEYGTIFDDLIKQFKEENKQSLDLNVGELQMYGTVTWLNALDELGKMKKGTDLITLVFIFKAGVVVLAQERVRGKKKTKPSQGRPPTSIEGGDLVRFQLAIPVDQLQVRALVGETERHGVWELIHCRSEKEGRPEKVFQFASSHEARRDFVKVINNTIRESVRRMSLPGTKVKVSPSGPQSSSQTKSQQNLQQYIPYSSRRPESLVMRNVEKCKAKTTKGEPSRHSMDVEEKNAPSQYECVGPDFRTRSQTLTDLNTSDLQSANCPSGSQSTIASESRGSAKLVHASKNPTSYGGSQPMSQREGLGSPIWKPRHTTKRAVVRSPSGEEKGLEAGVFSSSAYGDYSNVVYDKSDESKHSSVLLTHPNACFEHEDTEC